jgi:hypothetical protein
MKRERILVLAVSLLTVVAVAGSAAASNNDRSPQQDKPSVAPNKPMPTEGKPSSPKPTEGRPTIPPPDTTAQTKEFNEKNRPPVPTDLKPSVPMPAHDTPSAPSPAQGNPKGSPPATGTPSKPKPEAMPGPNKPERIEPSERPESPGPTLPMPKEPMPGPKPEHGIPNGTPPDHSTPNADAPKPTIKTRQPLNTLTQAELQALVDEGYDLTEVLKADGAAGKGIGSVDQILAWRAEGKSWSDIMKMKPRTPPAAGLYAEDLRALLAEPDNTGIHSLVDTVAAQIGASVDVLLELMGDQYTLSDIRSAASLAAVAGQDLQSVLALKNSANTWQDVANQLKH